MQGCCDFQKAMYNILQAPTSIEDLPTFYSAVQSPSDGKTENKKIIYLHIEKYNAFIQRFKEDNTNCCDHLRFDF